MARSLSLVSRVISRVIPAVALGAVVAASGCGGGGAPEGPSVLFDACAPLAVVADPNATADEIAGITAGLALWDGAAGTKLSLGTAAGTDPDAGTSGGPDASAAAPPALPIHFQIAADPFHGLYDAPNGQIYLNTDLTGHPLAVTVAHEIGHAFGLVHIPPDQRASLMNAGNLTVEPTPADVQTLQARWGSCTGN